jgi:hypothetical protein
MVLVSNSLRVRKRRSRTSLSFFLSILYYMRGGPPTTSEAVTFLAGSFTQGV